MGIIAAWFAAGIWIYSRTRFLEHDNSHTLVTELAESGAGDEVIVSIAGHVSRAIAVTSPAPVDGSEAATAATRSLHDSGRLIRSGARQKNSWVSSGSGILPHRGRIAPWVQSFNQQNWSVDCY